MLTALEQNAVPGFPAPGSAAFFNLVLNHTLQGTFGDPYYGGNRNFAGWDLVGYPGVRLAVTPDEQRLGPAPAPAPHVGLRLLDVLGPQARRAPDAASDLHERAPWRLSCRGPTS